MHAAVAPALKSRWEVKDVPTPEAGPNQVLIKLHASGLCFTDVHQTNGEFPGGEVERRMTASSARASSKGGGATDAPSAAPGTPERLEGTRHRPDARQRERRDGRAVRVCGGRLGVPPAA